MEYFLIFVRLDERIIATTLAISLAREIVDEQPLPQP
jgi:hypothetical protein